VIYNARMLEVQVALEELQLAVHLLIHWMPKCILWHLAWILTLFGVPWDVLNSFVPLNLIILTVLQ
jgi:hypothetical protein